MEMQQQAGLILKITSQLVSDLIFSTKAELVDLFGHNFKYLILVNMQPLIVELYRGQFID